MRYLTVVAALALALGGVCAPACATAEPPWVGIWKISLPDGRCHEIYRMHPDGTMLVTSAQEVSESTIQISTEPSAKGYYKMVDTVTRDNGKKDCTGEVMEVGHTVTQFIRFHPSGNMFLMCEEESLEKCIGWFIRQKGLDT